MPAWPFGLGLHRAVPMETIINPKINTLKVTHERNKKITEIAKRERLIRKAQKMGSGAPASALSILDCKNRPKRKFLGPARGRPFWGLRRPTKKVVRGSKDLDAACPLFHPTQQHHQLAQKFVCDWPLILLLPAWPCVLLTWPFVFRCCLLLLLLLLLLLTGIAITISRCYCYCYCLLLWPFHTWAFVLLTWPFVLELKCWYCLRLLLLLLPTVIAIAIAYWYCYCPLDHLHCSLDHLCLGIAYAYCYFYC